MHQYDIGGNCYIRHGKKLPKDSPVLIDAPVQRTGKKIYGYDDRK
jgi:hypothetical protein